MAVPGPAPRAAIAAGFGPGQCSAAAVTAPGGGAAAAAAGGGGAESGGHAELRC